MKKSIIVLVVVIVIGLLGFLIIPRVFQHETSEEIDSGSTSPSATEQEKEETNNLMKEESVPMRIHITDGNHSIVFQLNNSEAAKSLYEQLPLNVSVENYSSNEKIFYPPKELNTNSTPTANGSDGAGVLAYYAPWRDVVMFYDTFRSSSSLYELGTAQENINQIENLSGEITIEKVES